MPLSRISQRQLILAWIGIALAWAVAAVLAAILAPESALMFVVGTAAAALAAGALVTRRLLRTVPRARFKTRDLRAHRKLRG